MVHNPTQIFFMDYFLCCEKTTSICQFSDEMDEMDQNTDRSIL